MSDDVRRGQIYRHKYRGRFVVTEVRDHEVMVASLDGDRTWRYMYRSNFNSRRVELLGEVEIKRSDLVVVDGYGHLWSLRGEIPT